MLYFKASKVINNYSLYFPLNKKMYMETNDWGNQVISQHEIFKRSTVNQGFKRCMSSPSMEVNKRSGVSVRQLSK